MDSPPEDFILLIATLDLLLGIAIGAIPWIRYTLTGCKTLSVLPADLWRILLYILGGYRNVFSLNPLLCGLIWLVLLPAPIYVVLACSIACRKKRASDDLWNVLTILYCLLAYLFLNVRNDVWVHMTFKTSMATILPRNRSLSLPVKATRGPGNPVYNAIGLVRIKELTNTSGLYVCLDRLLFSGKGPAFYANSCCGPMVSWEDLGENEDGPCQQETENDDEVTWSVKLDVHPPASLVFFNAAVSELLHHGPSAEH
jgi:hypothetical protein